MIPPALLPILPQMTQPTPADMNVPLDAKMLLDAALAELPAESRLVLCLHYYEELNLDEIAAVLGVRRSRVESLHKAALARLFASGSLLTQECTSF